MPTKSNLPKKLRFSTDFLNRKYKTPAGVAAWGDRQALKFTKRTGVPFTHAPQAAGVYVFHPTFNEATPLVNDPQVIEAILSRCKNDRYPVAFHLLARETGLPLLTLMGACKYLLDNQFALAGYNHAKTHIISIRWYPGQCRKYGASETVKQSNDYLDLLARTRLVRGMSQRNLRGA